MKKLVLVASILALSTSAAFAQVVPTAPTTSFAAPGVQLAHIDQVGSANQTLIDQTTGINGVADISQTGNGLFVDVINQTDSGVNNIFSDPANIVDIDQVGENARARTRQSNTTGGTANTIVIEQHALAGATTPFAGFALNAGVFQDSGSDNQSSVIQGVAGTPVSGLTASNVQLGESNRSVIAQNAFPSADPITRGLVFQDGDFNESNLVQEGNDHLADITQTGNSNVSDVTQTGEGQDLLLVQTGLGHVATVNQGTTDGNMVDINQTGANNVATVNQ